MEGIDFENENVEERDFHDRLDLGHLVDRESRLDHDGSVDVVRLEPVRDETTVDDDSKNLHFPDCLDQPSQRLHLDLTDLGWTTEPLTDLINRRGMDASRQVAIGLERWDQGILDGEDQ